MNYIQRKTRSDAAVDFYDSAVPRFFMAQQCQTVEGFIMNVASAAWGCWMDSISNLIAAAVKRNDKKYLAELKAAFKKQIKVVSNDSKENL